VRQRYLIRFKLIALFALELEPAIRSFRQNLFLCGEEAATTFHDGNAPLPPIKPVQDEFSQLN